MSSLGSNLQEKVQKRLNSLQTHTISTHRNTPSGLRGLWNFPNRLSHQQCICPIPTESWETTAHSCSVVLEQKMRVPNLYILCAQIPVGHFGQGGNWKLARGQHRIRSKATQVNKHNYMFCTQTSPQSTQKINVINCTLKSKFHLNFATSLKGPSEQYLS